jgi:glutamate--cysteine ligase catalytic subunit
MEVQITDFENAAFAIFMVLVTRAILSFNLNFYIPIAKVTENMEAAHARNAVLDQKFYFRKDPFPVRHHRHPNHPNGTASSSEASTPTPQISRPPTPTGPVEDEYERMSINTIINGDPSAEQGGFPGLIPMVESYLNSMNVDVVTRCELARHLDLIRKRASGKLWTGAKWIRNFVDTHEKYGHDSVVNEDVCYDLVKKVEEITQGHSDAGWEILGACRRTNCGP